MELQNLLNKKYKRKNFFTALAVTTAGYMVMRTTLYKIFSRKSYKRDSASNSNIKIRINSSAVSRGKLPKGQTKTGETNV